MNISEPCRRAYAEGREHAVVEDATEIDNPYPQGFDEHRTWLYGFNGLDIDGSDFPDDPVIAEGVANAINVSLTQMFDAFGVFEPLPDEELPF